MTRLLGEPDAIRPLPRVGASLLDALDRAALVGRGGARFSVATKWRAVAQRSHGGAVVVVNGAEGEPHSKKDQVLMTTRPHLVLDGAFIAARAVRAQRIVLYVGERHRAAQQSMLRAVAQRGEPERHLVAFAAAPDRYVAGAESAAIHFLNEGVATPTNVPPYPFERGVGGAPTLVQNVETLAHVAVLARTGAATNTTLITLAGAVAHPGVVEVETSRTVAEVIGLGGGSSGPTRAVLVGGYFGSWLEPKNAWDLRLDAARLGCGVIGVLAASRCPVCEVAGIMRYLAGESSAQCGPCFFGLRALADSCTRIAQRGSHQEDLQRLRRWTVEVRGRGACRHPDGAVMFLASALEVFAEEFSSHRPHAARMTA